MKKKLREEEKEREGKEVELKELEVMNKDYKAKLLESQAVIESNNQMIQYLNKQLNQSHKPLAYLEQQQS